MKRIIYLIALTLVARTASAQICIGVNDTSAKIPIQAISSSDHVTEKTDVSSLTCRRWKNGTDGACSGTSAEVSDANHPGLWQYTFGAGDVDTAGSLVLRFTASGMDTFRSWVGVGCSVAIQSGGIGALSGSYDGTISAKAAATPSANKATYTLSAGVTADDEFNDGVALVIFNTSGKYITKSCILDSTTSGGTVVTITDTSALVSTGFYYILQPDQGCAARLTDRRD